MKTENSEVEISKSEQIKSKISAQLEAIQYKLYILLL